MSRTPPVKEFDGLPVLPAEKVKYLDKKASLEYGIPAHGLMENAGRAAAGEIIKFAAGELGKKASGLLAVVCCGRGNNGGDGLVAARYLKKAGALVKVFILPPTETGYGELVAKNLQALKDAGIDAVQAREDAMDTLKAALSSADLLVDALLGISAEGKPSGPVSRVIQLMNQSARPVVALDLPSGLSPDTGHYGGASVIARLTLTFGFAKPGLLEPRARKSVGRLKVLSIGYPKGLTDEARRRR